MTTKGKLMDIQRDQWEKIQILESDKSKLEDLEYNRGDTTKHFGSDVGQWAFDVKKVKLKPYLKP